MELIRKASEEGTESSLLFRGRVGLPLAVEILGGGIAGNLRIGQNRAKHFLESPVVEFAGLVDKHERMIRMGVPDIPKFKFNVASGVGPAIDANVGIHLVVAAGRLPESKVLGSAQD